MERDRDRRDDLLIRPDGTVERLDMPGPEELAGSYAASLPPHRRARAGPCPRDRRRGARYPEHLLRGRLVDIEG